MRLKQQLQTILPGMMSASTLPLPGSKQCPNSLKQVGGASVCFNFPDHLALVMKTFMQSMVTLALAKRCNGHNHLKTVLGFNSILNHGDASISLAKEPVS